MSRFRSSLFGLCLLAVSCGDRDIPEDEPGPRPPGDAAVLTATQAGLGQDSRFGVDYVFPFQDKDRDERWPRALAATGAGWLNMADVSWRAVEPQPPTDQGHHYRWEKLDEAVRAYQGAGFRLVFGLRLGKGWFTGPIRWESAIDHAVGRLFIHHSDRLPLDQHRDDYRAWIRALVERYDGDGQDDMPGLRHPVRHFQVGNEYANAMFWTGSVEDYAVLLRETAQAAREANPEVVIISNGIRWNDMFHGDPDGALFETRLASFLAKLPSDAYRTEWQRVRQVTDLTVALAPHYDVLDAGGNGPYPTVSQGYMSWAQQGLARAGAAPAVWDMEARSEPALKHAPHTFFHPELLVPDGEALMGLLKKPRHADHGRAVAWYRAEQARILARVFTTRFSAGFDKVFLGMPYDWDKSVSALATPNPFIGLCDRDGKPWPALAAFAAMVRALDGFEAARVVQASGGVALHRFDFEGGRPSAWVAWLEDERVRGLDDPLPSRSVALPGVPAGAVATPIPTSTLEPKTLRVGAGGVLTLTPTPVIVEVVAED